MTATAVTARPAAAKPRAAVGHGADAGTENWVGPMIVLVVGMFMTVLDTSIVNVTIPTLQAEFGGSTADLAWVATAYTLVLGVVVPSTAWVGERFGLGRIYIASLIGFAAASALCGLAWNVPSLIAFRVLQAVPGGLLPPVTMAMLFRIVPPQKLGSAMGMYGLGVIAAPALGPTLGGYLVEYVNWRLVFYINVPVAILGVVMAVLLLPKFAQRPVFKFDTLGFLAVATAMVCLLLAFSEGHDWGWTSYAVIGLLIAGVLALATFVVIEFEVDHPLLDLTVFKNGPFGNSLLIMSIVQIGMFATMFYIPVFLQVARGLPALDAGLIMLPQGLVAAVVAPISGRLYDRIGPRYLVLSGLLIAAWATWLMAGLSVDVPKSTIIFWTCLRSFGTGLAMMSIMTSGTSALPPSQTTSGTAVNNVMQRVSGAFGLAVMSSLVTSEQTQMAANNAALYASSDPRFAHLGAAAISQLSRMNALTAMVGSYSDMFKATAIITAIAALGAIPLRSGPVKRAGGPGAAAMME